MLDAVGEIAVIKQQPSHNQEEKEKEQHAHGRRNELTDDDPISPTRALIFSMKPSRWP
ncbi:MAG: hypothetical protein KDK99_09605 [Verrucomicrobiales bacterium]|nr:hypothetical protein [Verrucomicrobiales bacterium]